MANLVSNRVQYSKLILQYTFCFHGKLLTLSSSVNSISDIPRFEHHKATVASLTRPFLKEQHVQE